MSDKTRIDAINHDLLVEKDVNGEVLICDEFGGGVVFLGVEGASQLHAWLGEYLREIEESEGGDASGT